MSVSHGIKDDPKIEPCCFAEQHAASGMVGDAKRSYRRFVEEGAGQGHRSDLTGGGLIRSQGGWPR